MCVWNRAKKCSTYVQSIFTLINCTWQLSGCCFKEMVCSILNFMYFTKFWNYIFNSFWCNFILNVWNSVRFILSSVLLQFHHLFNVQVYSTTLKCGCRNAHAAFLILFGASTKAAKTGTYFRVFYALRRWKLIIRRKKKPNKNVCAT